MIHQEIAKELVNSYTKLLKDNIIEENEVNSQPETETDLTTKDFKCKF